MRNPVPYVFLPSSHAVSRTTADATSKPRSRKETSSKVDSSAVIFSKPPSSASSSVQRRLDVPAPPNGASVTGLSATSSRSRRASATSRPSIRLSTERAAACLLRQRVEYLIPRQHHRLVPVDVLGPRARLPHQRGHLTGAEVMAAQQGPELPDRRVTEVQRRLVQIMRSHRAGPLTQLGQYRSAMATIWYGTDESVCRNCPCRSGSTGNPRGKRGGSEGCGLRIDGE